MTVLLIANLTLRELVRRRLVLLVSALTLAVAALSAWGLWRLGTAAVAETMRLGVAASIVLMLAFFFSFVVALGAALIAAPVLAEGIANGEILVLLARPIRRFDVVFGRWLGTLAALWIYVAVAGGLELAIVRATTGYVPPHPGIALVYLAGVATVVTTAAIALATRLPSLAAGAVAAIAFGVAWMGGIVQSIGLAVGNASVADAGTIVTLLFPSDALWRGANYALQPAIVSGAAAHAGTSFNPFAVAAPPPLPLLVWAAAWVVVVFSAGSVALARRDL